jgi:hypothetical protein
LQTFWRRSTLLQLTGTSFERSDFLSFNQLVQELINGTVQRHVFTQWELELLLDLQICPIRKCSRADVLRRYLKAVQLHFTEDATTLLRLSAFVEQEGRHRTSSQAVTRPGTAVGARSTR